MSSKTRIGYEVSHDEHAAIEEYEEAEEPELRPSVAQEINAKVDGIAPGTVSRGMSLEAEERMVAREWEVRRTRVRWDRRQDSDREARTRNVVEEVNTERRYEIGKRAASVDR